MSKRGSVPRVRFTHSGESIRKCMAHSKLRFRSCVVIDCSIRSGQCDNPHVISILPLGDRAVSLLAESLVLRWRDTSSVAAAHAHVSLCCFSDHVVHAITLVFRRRSKASALGY